MENKKVNQGAKPIISEENFPTPTIAMTLGDFSEIENIFKQIPDGNIVFNNNRDGVDTYRSDYFDLSKYFPELTKTVYLQVNVYKYIKGAKFNSGYEGLEWIVDLDQWRSWLIGLNMGENKIKTLCSDWGCQKLENSQSIIAKKINTNKYHVSDGYFKPGGNSNRGYTTYDAKNNMIIDVRLDYYSEKDSIQMLGVFSKIESILP